MTPLDYVRSVSDKTRLDDLSGYQAFVINRMLAAHPDCIMYVNEMNLNHHISNRWQYDYLFHSIRQKQRYGSKLAANDDGELEAVMRYLGLNKAKAKEARRVLPADKIAYIKSKYVGGDGRPDREPGRNQAT